MYEHSIKRSQNIPIDEILNIHYAYKFSPNVCHNVLPYNKLIIREHYYRVTQKDLEYSTSIRLCTKTI